MPYFLPSIYLSFPSSLLSSYHSHLFSFLLLSLPPTSPPPHLACSFCELFSPSSSSFSPSSSSYFLPSVCLHPFAIFPSHPFVFPSLCPSFFSSASSTWHFFSSSSIFLSFHPAPLSTPTFLPHFPFSSIFPCSFFFELSLTHLPLPLFVLLSLFLLPLSCSPVLSSFLFLIFSFAQDFLLLNFSVKAACGQHPCLKDSITQRASFMSLTWRKCTLSILEAAAVFFVTMP